MNKYKTLIILDWDDTLFPTSWTVKNNIDINDGQTRNKYIVYFFQLDLLLSQLLTRLSQYGQVVIVTNATAKWIMISSNILPTTQKLLKNNIIIISARDAYGNKYPGNMNVWKKKTFKDVTNKFFRNYEYQNIISGGDAEYEFVALTDLYDVKAVYKNKILKTIRFKRDPSFEDLIDQLNIFDNCASKILNNFGHLDLKFMNK